VFAVAAETGWPEERILFMPLARLAQYQHCLLRRNGVRTHWSGARDLRTSLREQLKSLKMQWNKGGMQMEKKYDFHISASFSH